RPTRFSSYRPRSYRRGGGATGAPRAVRRQWPDACSLSLRLASSSDERAPGKRRPFYFGNIRNQENRMAFKPNYNHQRAERTRAKEQKKQEKLQRREEKAAKRKAGDVEKPSASDVAENG